MGNCSGEEEKRAWHACEVMVGPGSEELKKKLGTRCFLGGTYGEHSDLRKSVYKHGQRPRRDSSEPLPEAPAVPALDVDKKIKEDGSPNMAEKTHRSAGAESPAPPHPDPVLDAVNKSAATQTQQHQLEQSDWEAHLRRIEAERAELIASYGQPAGPTMGQSQSTRSALDSSKRV